MISFNLILAPMAPVASHNTYLSNRKTSQVLDHSYLVYNFLILFVLIS